MLVKAIVVWLKSKVGRGKCEKSNICYKDGDKILFGPWENELGPEVVKGYNIGYDWASRQKDLRYLEKHLLIYDQLVSGWRKWSSRGRYSPLQLSEGDFSKWLRDDIDHALVLWEALEEGEPDSEQLDDYLEKYFADKDEYDQEAHHFGVGLGVLSYMEENRVVEK